MKTEVTSLRLISGLLSEIESRNAIVQCTDGNEEEMQITSLQLQDSSGSEEIVVRIPLAHPSKQLNCEALLSNRRCRFKAELFDIASHTYIIRPPMDLIELRDTPRWALENRSYPAEIRYPGGISLGFAKDMSFDHLAIELSSAPDTIQPGVQTEIVVRSRFATRDILFQRCELITKMSSGKNERLIFRVTKNTNHSKEIRSARYAINPTTISFSGRDLHGLEFSGEISVDNISITGFSGTIFSTNKKQHPVLGLLLHSQSANIVFSAVRRHDNRYGFVVLDQHRSANNSWFDFFQNHCRPLSNELSSTEDLATLLLESNFLKPARLRKYGNEIERHLPHSMGLSNNSLVRRFVLADDGVSASRTVSLFRFTDHSWIMHEGASGVNRTESMDSFYQEVIGLISDEGRFISDAPKYLCVYYNPKIPIIDNYWKNALPGIQCSHLPTLVYSLAHKPKSSRGQTELEVRAATDLSLDERVKINESFGTPILALLDAFFSKSPNRSLSSLIASLGPSHRAELSLIEDTKSRNPLAFAYKVSTYYGTNVSGVVTSLFVFLARDIDNPKLNQIKNAITSNPALLNGTSDVVVVTSSEKQGESLSDPESRRYCWLLADLVPTIKRAVA